MGVKQQIPSSTNAPKSMSFAKLRGLDCSTSPFEVSPTRAVDMRNIINDDGINHKRQGWTENTKLMKKLGVFGQDIVGIYQIDYRYIVVKSDSFNIITDSQQILFQQAIEGGEIIGARIVKLEDNRYLIVSDLGTFKGIDILILENNTINFQKFDYAPMTTISINADSEETATRQSFEEPSLTTTKKRNSLISSDKTYRLTIQYTGETEDYLQLVSIYKEGANKNIQKGFYRTTEVTAILLSGKYKVGVTLINNTNHILTNEDGEELVKDKYISINKDTTIYVKEVK